MAPLLHPRKHPTCQIRNFLGVGLLLDFFFLPSPWRVLETMVLGMCVGVVATLWRKETGEFSELGIGGVFFDLDIGYSKSPYLVKLLCVDSGNESLEIRWATSGIWRNKTTSQLFSEKIATDNWALNGDSHASAFQWGASILLSWRNLPSCSIWSLVTPTSLFEIFIWAVLSSTWMCSDMLGCLKLTLGTKYLEVCRYLQQQIQAMQEKPSTFLLGDLDTPWTHLLAF